MLCEAERRISAMASSPRVECVTRVVVRSLQVMAKWPEDPDDPVDPAFAPLIEAGEGEAEGFELAAADLIENAEHGQHGTEQIWRDAEGFGEEEIPGLDDERYGEADNEEPEF